MRHTRTACAVLALALLPLSHASAVQDTLRVRLGSGSQAFVAWPPAKGPAPSVVLIHGRWGLDESVRESARRLARQGYVAVAPDLYHGRVPDGGAAADGLVRALDEEKAIADLDAAVQWLRSQPRSAKERIGVVGFSMGGGLSLDFALHKPEIAAVVLFYGRPEANAQRLAGLRAPLQAHFGAEDGSVPAARVNEMRAALQKAGKTADLYVYPGAGHAFMDESRSSYHGDAAKQAWARTLAFLQRALKGEKE